LRLAVTWIAIALFGVFDEFHEQFIPGRGAELMDWIMDATGSWLGLVIGYLAMRARWTAKLLR
jgi:VanZ family protein